MPLAAVLGLGTGLGLLLLIAGLTRRPNADPDLNADPTWLAGLAARRPVDRRRVALGLAVGLLVGAVPRWPVAAALAVGAAWVLPEIIGPDRGHARGVARIEAIATWTE